MHCYTTIADTLDDYRNVEVLFETKGNKSIINIHFEAKPINSIEQLKMGWQAIFIYFKRQVMQEW